ncbi:MAG: protein phosphatase 2C domain-containing protein [Caldilineaceae bacterium]
MNILKPAVGAKSQQGTRGKGNDDHYAWFAVERADLQRTIHIAVVADGVTSEVGGAQASRIAIEAIKAALYEHPDREATLSEWLAGAIMHANEEILFEVKRNPQLKGMSTTLVLGALAGSKLYVMHLGDSRAYLLRDQKLYQLTTDHTWAQEAMAAGAITQEEAAQHPGRNQLQRYLGAQHTINVARGLIDPCSGQMEEYLHLQPEDALLFCTDGLYRRLDAAEIKERILEHTGYPQDSIEDLIERAAAKGEVDDITAILVELPTERQPTVDMPTISVRRIDPNLQLSAPTHQSNWLRILLLLFVMILGLFAAYLFFMTSGGAAAF